MRNNVVSARRLSHRRLCCRRGSTVLLTVIFLALFATMAVAFMATTDLGLQQANNSHSTQKSQLAAESGLSYVLSQLQEVFVTPNKTGAEALAEVAETLADRLDGSTNLAGRTVSFDGSVIRVPSISLGEGQSFQASISVLENGHLSLVVHGGYGRAGRTVAMEAEPVVVVSKVFDFGMASKGKMLLWGSSLIEGVNDSHEADILGATYSDLEAVKIGSSSTLEGDIWTANPDSYISVTGNASVGGATGEDIADHLHSGVGAVAFPEIDSSLYERFATGTVITHGSDTRHIDTLVNARIMAGANPSFSSQMTIKGVLFIEVPNTVKFTGGVTLTGVIVTQDAGDNSFNSNTIEFAGTTNMLGVEHLDDLPEFHELRQLAGSALLAPGFGVKFNGDFGTVNGAMAAEKFIFSGNTSGTVCGPIISYGDTEFTVTSDTNIRIDRSQYDKVPPGFVQPTRFEPVASTYQEF